jgi:hypothetical protein
MSKMDGLRAMREARYAEATARAAQSTTKPAKAPKAQPPVAPPRAADPAPETDAVCGHRSMNGRTCTREAGHAAKSHRYS